MAMNKITEVSMIMATSFNEIITSVKSVFWVLTTFGGLAIGTGTLYLNQFFTSKDDFSAFQQDVASMQLEVSEMKGEIVDELTIIMSKKELARLESEISALNRRIQFKLCAAPECRFEKAEIEDKKRVVESLKEEIRLLTQKINA